MFPILHLHNIQAVCDADFDTAQYVGTLLLLGRHLQSQWTGHDEIAVQQFVLVSRGHDDSPSFSGDLDAKPEVVVGISSEVDQVVNGE